jgi:hypothetical protein
VNAPADAALVIVTANSVSLGGLGSVLAFVAARPDYTLITGYETSFQGYVLEHEFIAAAGDLVGV